MAFPPQSTGLNIPSQECDYGSSALGADSLGLRAPIRNSQLHPLEDAERTYRQRQEQLSYAMATRTFGLGFAMHLRHERAAAKFPSIGHLSGVLPRSNAMHDALTGRDLELDFTDTLAQDMFSRHSPHEIMERKLPGKF